jgi:AmmeMemoRadiSam system protein B/AmmeMemoRadiSam system protein A
MIRRCLFLWLLLAGVACSPSAFTGATGLPPTQTVTPPTIPATLPPTQRPTRQSGPVHKTEGAGRWYPADPHTLQAAVQDYVSQAEVEPVSGRLLAVIVPHAGYLYSGAVAGYAFRAMQQADCAGKTLAVIGDTHTGGGSAQIAVWAGGAFSTPLGEIPVDEELAQTLAGADPRIQFDQQAFRNEHPVENQIPFIQTVCPGARIVPIVIRQPSLENAQLLGETLVASSAGLAELGDLLIVASTDLSHFHPYDEAQQLDEVALQSMLSLDPQVVADSPMRCAELGLGGANPLTMCSQGAVMAALIAAVELGADRGAVLQYANSGDVPIGDRSQVVGYAAVALWEDSGQPANSTATFELPALAEEPAQPLPLSPGARSELVNLARRSAQQFLTNETFPPAQTDDPALLQSLGAYVTYRKGEDLRGCIGRLEGDRPAYLNVQYAAVAAALADKRFPPISPEELDDLSIEITLLHPLRLVHSPDEIQIGRHGVLMRIGNQDGAVFLPQVPLDEGWDLEMMLTQLCRKAGLPDDAWQREDTRLYAFEGEWFGEND